MNKLSRTLSLDVGDVRIGVAISDPFNQFAQPLVVVERAGGINSFRKLGEIIKTYEVNHLVVGMPLMLDGSKGEQAIKTEKFFGQLLKFLKDDTELAHVTGTLWDERLTSVQADRILQGTKKRNKGRREERDKISAAIILESYLLSKAQ